jgi:phosphoenolpyruvate carboxylase
LQSFLHFFAYIKANLIKSTMRVRNSYDFLVKLKYQVYNSIFLTLHFENIRQTGIELPLFQEFVKRGLEQRLDPKQIIEAYFKQQGIAPVYQDTWLFRFIQYVERQVVLIDALEDAAFDKLNDLQGEGTLHHFLNKVADAGKHLELQQVLDDFRIKIVLTAHPTQFYPGNVLGIIHDLTEAFAADNLHDIRILLEQLGQTPFFVKEKPSPFDEAVSLGWYLEHIFYHSVPAILRLVQKLYPDHSFHNFRLIELGFWPGGDRDGNPHVEVDTTLKVATRLRFMLLKQYHNDVRKLKRRLTFRSTFALLDSMEQGLHAALYHQNDFDLTAFQSKIGLLLLEVDGHHQGFFREEVLDLMFKTKAFGLHFASLDIRQDSRVIDRAYTAMAEDTTPLNDPVIQDTLDVFKAIQQIQELNGEQACHRFIISNCRSAKNVLQVYEMAQKLGMGGQPSLDVVPLFETIDDLQRSASEIEMLYENELYKKHLSRRKKRQYVMLGFSDGTKDGGYFAANWNIYKAKEQLTAISRKYGVEVVFFDGRGGPPARGGGNVRKYYAAQGAQIENKEIQITIQGQTISSRFSSVESAGYFLENLLTAGLESRLFNSMQPEDDASDQLMHRLAEESYKAYLQLKERPDFTSFLEFRTPLRFFGRANIGSRPSKRGAEIKLTLDDLRAIPFVGSWSAMKLNVPGYYGLGKALEVLKEEEGVERLQALFKESRFFESLISNSMQALAKSRIELTAYLANDGEYGELWRAIAEEYERTGQMFKEIATQEHPEVLLQSKESIALREDIILPVLVIQQYALMQLESAQYQSEVYEKLVVRSLYGIINAARNSA